jgi:hypothetical protein
MLDTLKCPCWFNAGLPIPDVYARSSDAEFILDAEYGEERGIAVEQLKWRECLVPVSAFALKHSDLLAHLVAVPGVDWKYEAARMANIRAWFARAGGARNGLLESPLLVSISGADLTLEDGWHRLGLAVFEEGLTEVTALCALVPCDDPTTPALD